MNGTTCDEAMSSSDALIWHIEQDPLLRSTIMTVWFLESAPTRERMRATVERMVAELPRFRQRVVDSRPQPRWAEVDEFNPDDHYRYEDLGGEASHDDVMASAQHWVREPFDRSRPLWQLGIFSGLVDGRAALVLKVHHAIADGVGFVLMLASLADIERNPLHRPKPPAQVVSLPAARRARRTFGEMVRLAATATATHPIASLRAAVHSALSVAKLVMPARKPLSQLMTGRSNELCLDVASCLSTRSAPPANRPEAASTTPSSASSSTPSTATTTAAIPIATRSASTCRSTSATPPPATVPATSSFPPES